MKVNRTLFRWSRLLHIYAAVALLVLLTFFAFTGITLNHPGWLSGDPVETELSFTLPEFDSDQGLSFTPKQIRELESQLSTAIGRLTLEADGDFAFIDAQMPGRFISGELDLQSGEVIATDTSYGITAWLNDLHKGRHTGFVWKLVLDICSVLILLFCASGLILLLPNKRHLRPATILGLATTAVIGLVLAFF